MQQRMIDFIDACWLSANPRTSVRFISYLSDSRNSMNRIRIVSNYPNHFWLEFGVFIGAIAKWSIQQLGTRWEGSDF